MERRYKEPQIRRMTARYATICPECKRPIAIGSEIATPTDRNRAGGRAFTCGYHARCAEFVSATWSDAPFMDDAARAQWDAHYERERAAWLRDLELDGKTK